MSQAFAAVKAGEESLLCRSYSRYPVAVVRGKGARLWDVDGKEYVDLLAGIAVTTLGHCNDEVNAALAAQAEKLWHVSNLFYQEEQLELARLLLSTSHHNKAFFCNSGAEANEACIKLARRYMRKIRQRDAYEIITLNGCFHGRTLGALAATGRENLSDGFTPLPEGFRQVPANDLDAMSAAITPATAAVLVEVVQGEGGIVPLSGDYLRQLEALCRQRGVLFMCDEVQAGLGRTGTFWAFQNHGLTPDAISVAKALANGLPMGAMLATDERQADRTRRPAGRAPEAHPRRHAGTPARKNCRSAGHGPYAGHRACRGRQGRVGRIAAPGLYLQPEPRHDPSPSAAPEY